MTAAAGPSVEGYTFAQVLAATAARHPDHDALVFPWLDLRCTLPLDVPVTIDLPALAPGEYEYTCGMNMMRGTIFVEPSGR